MESFEVDKKTRAARVSKRDTGRREGRDLSSFLFPFSPSTKMTRRDLGSEENIRNNNCCGDTSRSNICRGDEEKKGRRVIFHHGGGGGSEKHSFPRLFASWSDEKTGARRTKRERGQFLGSRQKPRPPPCARYDFHGGVGRSYASVRGSPPLRRGRGEVEKAETEEARRETIRDFGGLVLAGRGYIVVALSPRRWTLIDDDESGG